MKTVDEFKHYFEKELSSELDRLETPRKRILRLILITILSSLVLIAGAIYLFTLREKVPGIICGVVWIILVVVLGTIISKKINRIKLTYKEGVIRPMIGFISQDLNYHPTSFVSQQDYTKSGIFTQGVDRYKGDDLVEGKLDSTILKFSEIHSEYVTRDKDGKSQWHTIFKGIFFVADFNKDFKGKTYVLPDLAEKWFGGLGKMMQKANLARPQLIKMEDPVFEKAFVVYGSDQVEARYILSPKLMERIMELKKKAGTISMSFVNSQVNIAIKVKGNLFEPPIWSSMKKFSLIEKYFTYLVLAINIVEDLDLNTRIWTKE